MSSPVADTSKSAIFCTHSLVAILRKWKEQRIIGLHKLNLSASLANEVKMRERVSKWYYVGGNYIWEFDSGNGYETCQLIAGLQKKHDFSLKGTTFSEILMISLLMVGFFSPWRLDALEW